MDEMRIQLERFAEATTRGFSSLAEHYGTQDIRASRAAREIPRAGQIGDLQFLFHGAGCRFENGDQVVDVDFCDDGYFADWWRLSRYIQSTGLLAEPLQEQAYAELIAMGDAPHATVLGMRLHWR